MSDSGRTRRGVDHAAGSSANGRASGWLGASGRALKRTVAWLVDRIGFLAG